VTLERAFFVQARSDLEAAIRLEASRCDNCQILHALQMAVEKTAKGYAQRFGTFRTVHNAFSTGFPRIRTALLADASVRRRMGLVSRQDLGRVLRSVERTATAVESLNPSVAGRANANCEYPWTDAAGVTRSPARHRFGKPAGRVARLKLERFLDHVLARELRVQSLLAG